MITYKTGLFGYQYLFRFRGSALYKSVPPVILSSFVYILLVYTTPLDDNWEYRLFRVPEALDVLVALLVFFLQSRTNFSYGRYWEALSAVISMQSRFTDAGSELSAFHLQSTLYNGPSKPPSFGSHPGLQSIRYRERKHLPTMEDLHIDLDQLEAEALESVTSNDPRFGRIRRWLSFRGSVAARQRRIKKRQQELCKTDNPYNSQKKNKRRPLTIQQLIHGRGNSRLTKLNVCVDVVDVVDVTVHPHHRSNEVDLEKLDYFTSVVVTQQPKDDHDLLGDVESPVMNYEVFNKEKPPLFLQEAAHLLSLLSAVALSTLRNDLDGVGSPLIPFTPGQQFPHVDPDSYSADVRRDWDVSTHKGITVLHAIFGLDRTAKYRALYNAARPFRVIGGISDYEISVLQAARGPCAKVSVVNGWLIEFITREHLTGSVGPIHPAIFNRIHQLISDGIQQYNHARMISHNPFPFVHAQLTSFFVFVVVSLIPILMVSYVSNTVMGFILNFLTVMCFTGLHEVSRESEWPFKNVPNDIPLNNFQGQFNESLLSMFAGYHPDSFWTEVVVTAAVEHSAFHS